jgi:hypothetical protein
MRSDEEYGYGEKEEKTSAAAKATGQHHDATSDKQRTHTIRAGYGVRECRSLAFTASVVSSQKRATSSTLPDLAASCTELQTPPSPPPATAAMSIPRPSVILSVVFSLPAKQTRTTKPPEKTQQKNEKNKNHADRRTRKASKITKEKTRNTNLLGVVLM